MNEETNDNGLNKNNIIIPKAVDVAEALKREAKKAERTALEKKFAEMMANEGKVVNIDALSEQTNDVPVSAKDKAQEAMNKDVKQLELERKQELENDKVAGRETSDPSRTR